MRSQPGCEISDQNSTIRKNVLAISTKFIRGTKILYRLFNGTPGTNSALGSGVQKNDRPCPFSLQMR